MKDSGLRIRVERELREKFVETCRVQDRPAAQVIREFMKQYVRDHSDDADNEKGRQRKK
jgi:Ribonuclease G/E